MDEALIRAISALLPAAPTATLRAILSLLADSEFRTDVVTVTVNDTATAAAPARDWGATLRRDLTFLPDATLQRLRDLVAEKGAPAASVMVGVTREKVDQILMGRPMRHQTADRITRKLRGVYGDIIDDALPIGGAI